MPSQPPDAPLEDEEVELLDELLLDDVLGALIDDDELDDELDDDMLGPHGFDSRSLMSCQTSTIILWISTSFSRCMSRRS